MSNPFSNGSLWTDGTSSPPAAWNVAGKFFELFSMFAPAITYTGSPVATSTVVTQMELANVCLVPDIDIQYFVNGIDAGLSPDPVTHQLTIPPFTTLVLHPSGNYSECGAFTYSIDKVIQSYSALAPPGPFWQDLIGTVER